MSTEIGPAILEYLADLEGAVAELATEVLALQCAEPGPFAQAIAGIDTALHDLVARRAGVPLRPSHRVRSRRPG